MTFTNVWRNLLPICIVCLGLFLANSASALGLGEIQSGSRLGEPLYAEIPVLDSLREYRAEDLIVQKLDSKMAERLGYEVVVSNYGLEAELKNAASGVVVVVRTRQPLQEPFVNFQLELIWPGGSLVRDYTLFLDPPAMAEASDLVWTPVIRPGEQVLTPVVARPRTQPAVSPEARCAPNSGAGYQVKTGDTLSTIAMRWSQGRGLNRFEVMDWIFANNPTAFTGGSRDRLKSGICIHMPGSNATLKSDTLAPLLPSGKGVTVARPADSSTGSDVRTTSDGGGRSKAPSKSASAGPASSSEATKDSTAAEGLLRLSRQDAGQVPSFAELNRQSPEEVRAYLEKTRESVDQLQRDNEDLRRQIDKIETSDYLNNLKNLVELQQQQLDVIRRQRQAATAAGVADAGENASNSADSSMVEINAAAPVEEIENRSQFKWLAALGLFLLALVLFGLIVKRLWEQQKPRYSTQPRPVPVAPVVVGGMDGGVSAVRTVQRQPVQELDEFDVSDENLKHLKALDLGTAGEEIEEEASLAENSAPSKKTASGDDDWDELFDAIVNKDTEGEPGEPEYRKKNDNRS